LKPFSRARTIRFREKMASLKDIRARIKSTKNTQQITRAMKMVAAAKLRRSQTNIVNMRPYAHQILKIITEVAESHRVEHPLLTSSLETKKVLLVVLTSDRGLCGGFNTSINKKAEAFYNENKNKFEKIDFLFIGRKASEYFRRRQVLGIDTILNLAREVSYPLAAEVADRLMQNYMSGEYDQIQLVYNEFKSAIVQEVVTETLLPLDIRQPEGQQGQKEDPLKTKDILFEPRPEKIINQLLEKHFAVQVYRCMSESIAAEHAARMVAMENATNNASEVIASLTLTYNNLRQSSITTELIEITSGAEALKA